MNGSDPKQTARDLLTEAHPALVGLSHWIHANPELGYQEVLASGWVADWMTSAGFEVRRGVGGMETALAASFGNGPFHVALCAEYDALPGVGHACGHNVIAASAVGAAVALAAVADELGLRVTLLGTPAEEGGGGKLLLIEAGEFDGVHAALMVHPGPDDIVEPELLGVRTLNVEYTGREAHAAGFPELGINAADALTVAQVGIGLLRQHLDPGDRVHGIVTKGGDAPNIVPAHTTASFMVRSRTREGLEAVTSRVSACFEAGALATGAALVLTQEVAYSPMLHDPDLAALYQLNAEATGRWFDPAARMVVSTDMGDVSHVVPSIHPIIGIGSRPFVNHQPEFAEAAVSPVADQTIFDGALLLAWTVIDAAQSSAIRERLTGSAWTPDALQHSDEPAADEWERPEDLGDASAFTEAGEPPRAEVELTVAETIAFAETWASAEELAEAERAAEVAWAAEPPTAVAWESEPTADDLQPSTAPVESETDAPEEATDPEEEAQIAAANAAEVAWAAEPQSAAAWEGEETADDAEPEAPTEAEAPTEPEAVEPESDAEAEPTDAEEEAQIAATNAAEVAWAAEAPTAAPWEGEDAADDAEPEAPAEPEVAAEAEAPAEPEPAVSASQPGDDYAQWEADFAAALDSLDRPSTASAAGNPSEDSASTDDATA